MLKQVSFLKKLLYILGSEITVNNNDDCGASFSFQLTTI